MKIYVGNLPFTVDEEAFKALLSGFKCEEITLITDKFSGRSKGFGFVVISDEAIAKKAISELNGKEFEGRELKVSEAKPMNHDRQKNNFNRNNQRNNRRY